MQIFSHIPWKPDSPLSNKEVTHFLNTHCSNRHWRIFYAFSHNDDRYNSWLLRILRILHFTGHCQTKAEVPYDGSVISMRVNSTLAYPFMIEFRAFNFEGGEALPRTYQLAFILDDLKYQVWFKSDLNRVKEHGHPWYEVIWSAEISEKERNDIAELYLGCYYDENGDLKASPSAFGLSGEKLNEEETLAYLRGRKFELDSMILDHTEPKDFEFQDLVEFQDQLGDDSGIEVLVAHLHDLLGLDREYGLSDLRHICDVYFRLGYFHHPSCIEEARAKWIKLLNTYQASISPVQIDRTSFSAWVIIRNKKGRSRRLIFNSQFDFMKYELPHGKREHPKAVAAEYTDFGWRLTGRDYENNLIPEEVCNELRDIIKNIFSDEGEE